MTARHDLTPAATPELRRLASLTAELVTLSDTATATRAHHRAAMVAAHRAGASVVVVAAAAGLEYSHCYRILKGERQ